MATSQIVVPRSLHIAADSCLIWRARWIYLSPRLIRLTRIVCANLHREPIRIHDVETETASLFVDRSCPPRLEIRSHGVLVEVVDSDCDMVYFAWRLTWSQDQ